ncbi:MAG: hypothetical protein H0V82_01965 [Candidatus Protochlamydia sp.]|nr:hypothetical protein [Candidatus Protochlamydia sp.]
MKDNLEHMIKDVVQSSVPSLPREILRDGQSLMVITNTLSLDDFSQFFTSLRADRYGFIEIPSGANDNYKFTKEWILYLDTLITDGKKQVKCTDKDQSDMTKLMHAVICKETNNLENANENVLKTFSQSTSHRARYPFHIQEAISFTENLLMSDFELRKQFNKLIANANDAEKYRLYDLKNEPSIRNGDTINQKAAEFALSQKPETLNQFVMNYQFYKAWVKRISEELSLSIDKQGNNLTNKEFKAEVARQSLSYIQQEGSVAVDLLINSKQAAQRAGVGPYKGINQKDIQAYAAHIKFSSDTNLAYHVLKHFNELPASISSASWDNSGLNIAKELEEIFRQTFIYLKTAREVIEKGSMTTRPCQLQLNKNILTFTADLDQPPVTLKTIVHIIGDEVVIATCMPQGK